MNRRGFTKGAGVAMAAAVAGLGRGAPASASGHAARAPGDPILEGDAAGGVLSGEYPTPGFAEDMTTQAELDAHGHAASAITTASGPTAQAQLDAIDERLGGLLSFSPDFLRENALLYDEFFGGGVTTGQIGGLGWTVNATNGGAVAAASSVVTTAPGWYGISTGTGSGGLCLLGLHGWSFSLQGHPKFTWEQRVSMGQPNDGVHNASWRVGLTDSTGLAPNNGFYFEYTSAVPGGRINCRTAKAGVKSPAVSTGIVPATIPGGQPAPWYRLRIVSDGDGAASFYVDDSFITTITTQIPTTEAYGPTMSILKTLNSGTARSLKIDYFYLLLEELGR